LKKQPGSADAEALLARAELLLTSDAVLEAVRRVGSEITAVVKGHNPLVLTVMRGGVVFAGHLLPVLAFPLDFDYVDATRYGSQTSGGRLQWRVDVPDGVRGRTVVVVDDILDAGTTLAAIRDRLLEKGAAKVWLAVFADKKTGRSKPVAADFVGVSVPDRFVFGFGMDIRGMWRNLPAVYALDPND